MRSSKQTREALDNLKLLCLLWGNQSQFSSLLLLDDLPLESWRKKRRKNAQRSWPPLTFDQSPCNSFQRAVHTVQNHITLICKPSLVLKIIHDQLSSDWADFYLVGGWAYKKCLCLCVCTQAFCIVYLPSDKSQALHIRPVYVYICNMCHDLYFVFGPVSVLPFPHLLPLFPLPGHQLHSFHLYSLILSCTHSPITLHSIKSPGLSSAVARSSLLPLKLLFGMASWVCLLFGFCFGSFCCLMFWLSCVFLYSFGINLVLPSVCILGSLSLPPPTLVMIWCCV